MFATPEAAELAFYAALAQADMTAMRAVWAERDDIVCVHPLHERRVGRTAVMHSWESMFASGQGVVIRREAVQHIRTQSLAVHSLLEIIERSGASTDYPPLIATNIYVLTTSGWRMLLHQAAPAASNQNGRQQDVNTPSQVH